MVDVAGAGVLSEVVDIIGEVRVEVSVVVAGVKLDVVVEYSIMVVESVVVAGEVILSEVVFGPFDVVLAALGVV